MQESPVQKQVWDLVKNDQQSGGELKVRQQCVVRKESVSAKEENVEEGQIDSARAEAKAKKETRQTKETKETDAFFLTSIDDESMWRVYDVLSDAQPLLVGTCLPLLFRLLKKRFTVRKLYTFAAGYANSRDIDFAVQYLMQSELFYHD